MFDNTKDRINKLLGNKQELIRVKPRGETIQEKALDFFSDIYGHEPVKENVFRVLIAEENNNLLLDGPPATCKTLIMNIMQEKCNDVLYFDASNMSGAGFIEECYNNQKARLIIIDEADKLKKNDAECLLSICNNGHVVKTLKKVKYDFWMKNVKIFMTTNNVGKLSKPMRSRFQEYRIKPYSDQEFIEVVQYCLHKKFAPAQSEMIAKVLIAHDKKDVRHAISISKSIYPEDTPDDMLRVMENWINNMPTEAVDYN